MQSEVLIQLAHWLRTACRPTCGACLAACTGEACAEGTHHPRGLPVTHSGPVSWHELTAYTPHRLRRWAARQAFRGAEHIRSSQPMHPPVAPVWPVAPVKPAEEGGHISTGTRLQQVPTHYRGVQAVSVHDRLVQRVGFTCSPRC